MNDVKRCVERPKYVEERILCFKIRESTAIWHLVFHLLCSLKFNDWIDKNFKSQNLYRCTERALGIPQFSKISRSRAAGGERNRILPNKLFQYIQHNFCKWYIKWNWPGVNCFVSFARSLYLSLARSSFWWWFCRDDSSVGARWFQREKSVGVNCVHSHGTPLTVDCTAAHSLSNCEQSHHNSFLSHTIIHIYGLSWSPKSFYNLISNIWMYLELYVAAAPAAAVMVMLVVVIIAVSLPCCLFFWISRTNDTKRIPLAPQKKKKKNNSPSRNEAKFVKFYLIYLHCLRNHENDNAKQLFSYFYFSLLLPNFVEFEIPFLYACIPRVSNTESASREHQGADY